MALSEQERERYAAQLELGGWGEAAQERLRAASAIVVGSGSSGSLAAAHLAGAGVGRIGVVDGTQVELRGIARQTLHLTPELGASAAESTALKLGALNPEVVVEPYPVPIERANAEAILTGADVVLDCGDDPATLGVVLEAAGALGTVLVAGRSAGLSCFVTAVRPGRSACPVCVVWGPRPQLRWEGTEPGAHPSAALAAVGGLAASLLALEALRLLTGVGEPLLDRVLRIDARRMEPASVRVARRPDCPACAELGAPQQSGG